MSKKTNQPAETQELQWTPGSASFFAIFFGSILLWFFTDAPFLWTVGIGFVLALLIGAVIGIDDLKKTEENQKIALASAERKLCKLVDKHISTLARKRLQGISEDEYGVVDSTRWHNEVQHFFDNVLAQELTDEEKAAMLKNDVNKIMGEHVEARARRESVRLERLLHFNAEMTPIEYERFCSKQLNNAGWEARETQASGDQGADVLAKRNGELLVVQCKLYSKPVGNSAVQEVNAAKAYYRAHYSAVVTNAGYTRSAKQLAKTTGVMLLHHSDLVRLDDFLAYRVVES